MVASATVNHILISEMQDTEPYKPSGILTVGDNSDVTLNPSCGITVDGSGVYMCNGSAGLPGSYIGFVQTVAPPSTFGLCELRAYAGKRWNDQTPTYNRMALPWTPPGFYLDTPSGDFINVAGDTWTADMGVGGMYVDAVVIMLLMHDSYLD